MMDYYSDRPGPRLDAAVRTLRADNVVTSEERAMCEDSARPAVLRVDVISTIVDECLTRAVDHVYGGVECPFSLTGWLVFGKLECLAEFRSCLWGRLRAGVRARHMRDQVERMLRARIPQSGDFVNALAEVLCWDHVPHLERQGL